MILLDTNACVAAINGRPTSVGERIGATLQRGRKVKVSAVVVFELFYGVAKSARVEANLRAVETFLRPLSILTLDAEDGRAAAQIRAQLERAGKPIGPYDYLIAAQAVRHELTLITANEKEFASVPGLRFENWAS